MFDPDAIVHEVINLVQAHHQRIGSYLYANGIATLPEALQQPGPLRDDILLLVNVANGELERDRVDEYTLKQIVRLVEHIVNLLFVPPGGIQSAPIPGDFWLQSGIGQVLTHVQAWLQQDDLISQMVGRSMLLPMEEPRHEKPRLPKLRAKSLPVDFVHGLMGAIIDIFGRGGGTPELLYLSVKDLMPRQHYQHTWQQSVAALNPLYNYYLGKTSLLEPVDYAFLERLRYAMDKMYPQGSAYLEQQIGWSWWLNDYPIVKRQYSNFSLQHLLGAEITHALRTMSIAEYPMQTTFSDTSRFIWEEQQRVRVACRTFAQSLHYKGGIICNVKEGPQHVLLSFTDCPFCSGKRHDCSILLGVVQRMVLWLYGDRFSRGSGGLHPSFREISDGLLTIRTVQENSHSVAVLFAV